MSNQKIDETQVDFQAGASLTVKETDGTPTVANVDTIVVTNGTLTDDGGGQVSLSIGSGDNIIAVDLTDQHADISATSFGISTNGMYVLYWYILCTTADGSAGDVTLTLAYNDGTNARSIDLVSNFPITLLGATSFVETLYRGSGNVTYAMTHSGSYNNARVAIHLRVVPL